jgi:hypothetical protein
VHPVLPGSRLDADHPENGVLIPRLITILTPEWPRLGGCGSLFHGVISWRLAGRPLGCIPIRRLRRLQIPTTSATRPLITVLLVSQQKPETA